MKREFSGGILSPTFEYFLGSYRSEDDAFDDMDIFEDLIHEEDIHLSF